MTPILFTPRQLAEYIGISRSRLAAWRVQGRGPKFVKVGGRIRYRFAAVDEWLKQNEVANTGEGRLLRKAR